MGGSGLGLQDFLDASSDSSRRTRTILVALVVASVLALAGFLNSLPTGWMLQRLRAVNDPASDYVSQKLGAHVAPEDSAYLNFQSAVTRAYVDNVLTIDVPFFGITFDINDLGLIAGIGFTTVLTLLRFSIRTETLGLRVSFKAAMAATLHNPEQLTTFYDLLAMRQVLTLPHLQDDRIGWQAHRSRLLQLVPKFICLLPAVVYSLVAVHDYWTQSIGTAINAFHMQVVLVYTAMFWLIIVALSVWCFVKLVNIDRIWDEYWQIVREAGPRGTPAIVADG